MIMFTHFMQHKNKRNAPEQLSMIGELQKLSVFSD
jgi:hypothetical protein